LNSIADELGSPDMKRIEHFDTLFKGFIQEWEKCNFDESGLDDKSTDLSHAFSALTDYNNTEMKKFTPDLRK